MHGFRVVIHDEAGEEFIGMSQQLNWHQATLCRAFFFLQFGYPHAYVMVDNSLSRKQYELLQFNFGFTATPKSDGGITFDCLFKQRPWFCKEDECHGR